MTYLHLKTVQYTLILRSSGLGKAFLPGTVFSSSLSSPNAFDSSGDSTGSSPGAFDSSGDSTGSSPDAL